MDVLYDPVVDHLVGDDYEIEQVPTIAANLYARLVEIGVFSQPEDDLGGNAPAAPGEETGGGPITRRAGPASSTVWACAHT